MILEGDVMTEGNIATALLKFSIPMILGNLLQQLYNVVDTFIVGHYIGTDALAAVGSSFTLMTFLTSMILGLCMGSGVLFSMFYGAKEHDKMKVSFFVSFVGIAIFSIILQIICLLLINQILVFMNIPGDIYKATYDYLFIIFMGIIFTFLYNYFASLLRALGNSKTPLVFLAIAAIINIVLDIFFITSLNLNVAGAALATTIAQAFSGIGIMIYCVIVKKELLPEKKHRHFDRAIFKKIKDYSLLTCVQQSVAAFVAAVKIDSFAYMPVQDFGNAFSTYIAQNKGANLEGRIKAGLKVAITISTIFCLIISAIVFIFADKLMLIFIEPSKVEIIHQGAQYLQIEGICYVGIGCLFLLYGYYRGVGKPGISVVLTIISLGTRVVLAYAFAPFFGTLAIWWAIPIGWFLADATGIIFGIKKEKWLSNKFKEA